MNNTHIHPEKLRKNMSAIPLLCPNFSSTIQWCKVQVYADYIKIWKKQITKLICLQWKDRSRIPNYNNNIGEMIKTIKKICPGKLLNSFSN